MKKYLLILIAIIASCSVYAQKNKKEKVERDIPSEFEEMKTKFSESANEWVFSKVIQAENSTKEEIYNKVLEVLAETYKDSKDVIQNKDKESGIIIGKGFTDSNIRTINWASICRNRCWHIIKVEIKEGRYKLTIKVNSIWNETGSDLRHPFNGTEYKLTDFYPYWKDCKPKRMSDSFDNLKFAYDSSFEILNSIEKEVNQKLTSQNNNW